MSKSPPPDPADHAEDFSRRYSEALDFAVGQIMLELGLVDGEMGARDPDRNREHHCFFPSERDCGCISPSGQINLDSGVMNLATMDEPYGEDCGKLWRKSRLRDRIQAIIAHEMAEKECGDHELALAAAPETLLPVSQRAREIMLAMARGWKGR